MCMNNLSDTHKHYLPHAFFIITDGNSHSITSLAKNFCCEILEIWA